ncbi:MAG: DUF1275 domain-containing protein [Elusimicrobia bacterium]|nr:DUF1275 domain-containing protein [Elusimicrobiota bacterium]
MEGVYSLKNKSETTVFTPTNLVAFILTTMAGWIDAVGAKLFLYERSSYISGRGSSIGFWIYKGDKGALIAVVLIVISFILGSYIGARISSKAGLTRGLFFTASLIFIAAFYIKSKAINITTIIIPAAMGIQNATTSLTPIGRTTHLTGPSTDLGISLARKNKERVLPVLICWIGFPLGAYFGYNLANMATNNIIKHSTTLIIPAVIILLTAIAQRLIFHIPLLEIENKDRSKIL